MVSLYLILLLYYVTIAASWRAGVGGVGLLPGTRLDTACRDPLEL